MPLAQKVVHLLVQEYQTLLVQESENPDVDEEDDDSDEAELDDSQIPRDFINQGFAPEEDYRDFLDSLIGEAAGEFQEMDPDVLEDPLYKMNLKAEIANFIKGIARANLAALQQMATILDHEEMQTLDALLKSQ